MQDSVNFEMSSCCLQIRSKKTNENKSTWGIIVLKSNFFVHFLEELRIPRSPFEINWPLASLTYSTSSIPMKLLCCQYRINNVILKLQKEESNDLWTKKYFFTNRSVQNWPYLIEKWTSTNIFPMWELSKRQKLRRKKSLLC